MLRPGGKIAVLDFNNSSDPFVDGFQEFSLQNIVVPAAKLYGLGAEYEYLRPSIKQFATGVHFASQFACFMCIAVDWVPCCSVIRYPAALSLILQCRSATGNDGKGSWLLQGNTL